jgi:Tol biopolymer transport system component
MSPGRWRQIEELYQAARDLDGTRRAELLAQADPDLRREIEKLLDQPTSGSPLDSPAWEEAGAVATPSIGSQLGPYRIEERIGSGGMGEVYRAIDTRLRRAVAIKIPNEILDGRFAKEARAIAALNHPNICTIHDVGPNYIVMELVEGPTLAERMGKTPLSETEALAIARQIAAALDAAHQKGIVHRDLKPANIKVKPDGSIKVLDFGLARTAPDRQPGEIEETRTLTVTEVGTIAGTPAYMSPEQALGKPVDKRTDIWAFGVILYEMLTAGRLFDGANTAEVLRSVLTREPEWDRIPHNVRPLLRSCLERDPARRLRDIGDTPFLLEAPVEIRPRSTRLWWFAVVAALILGVLAGALALSRRGGAPDQPFLSLDIAPPEGLAFASGVNTSGFSISPDGRTAAFIVRVKGNTGLWIRALDGTGAHPVEGTEGAALPFWSPDSRSIAFFTKNTLKRVDLAGGKPQLVTDVAIGVGGTWGADGRILYGGWSTGLMQVSASGGKPVPFTTLDGGRGEQFHYWPQILPGGSFLYFVRSTKPEHTGVYAARLAEPHKATQLLHVVDNAIFAPQGINNTSGHLLWLRDETLVSQSFDAVSWKLSGDPHTIAEPVAGLGLHAQMRAAVSSTGVLLYSASNALNQLTWVDRNGKILGPLAEPAPYGQFRFSPDGRRLIFDRQNPGGSDLWIMDVDRAVSTRFTAIPGISIVPVWSPDGRTILFSSDSPFNMYRKDASGTSAEERLQKSPNRQFPNDWSQDDHWLLFEEIAGSHESVWVRPAPPQTGEIRPYPGASASQQSFARFSPDGHWVSFCSDESGRSEVYIDAFPNPRGKTRISTSGGQFPQWSPDGNSLFYVATADSTLVSVALQKGTGSIVPSTPVSIQRVTIVDEGVSPYLVEPNGRRLLILEPEKIPRPLKVIMNWPALLK